MPDTVITYQGEIVDEMSRERLIEVVKALGQDMLMARARLSAENERFGVELEKRCRDLRESS